MTYPSSDISVISKILSACSSFTTAPVACVKKRAYREEGSTGRQLVVVIEMEGLVMEVVKEETAKVRGLVRRRQRFHNSTPSLLVSSREEEIRRRWMSEKLN